jgi:hypothetical protein
LCQLLKHHFGQGFNIGVLVDVVERNESLHLRRGAEI